MAEKNLTQINTDSDIYYIEDSIARNNADMCAELITKRTQYETGTVTLDSGWALYSSTAGIPTVKRQGKVVYLNGVIKPTSTTTINASGVDVGTIDDPAFFPSETVYCLCQSSGTSFFFLRVYTDGRIHIERLRDVGNANGVYTDGTSSMWFPFSLSWIK